VVRDLGVEVGVERAKPASRTSTGSFTVSSAWWTNSRKSASSSVGNPSMRAMTLTGMCCAYCTAASTTEVPG
jgi:hypothetical protein